MSVSHKIQDERVSTHVVQEVRTPIGEVLVTYIGGKVVASFHPRYGYALCDFEDGRSPQMTLSVTSRRPPAVGDEVTLEGSSFEVKGVRMEHGRLMLLDGGTGVWRKWQE